MKRNSLKRSGAIFLFMLLVFISSNNVLAAPRFSDVKEGKAHYEGIYWLVDQGAITGYDDGTFRPYEPLKRDHAAKIIVDMLDLDLPKENETGNYFKDVNYNTMYAKEIVATAQAGIFTGDNGNFLPREELSREQMATTLVRAYAFQLSQPEVDINLNNISPPHKENVQILADLGITIELDNFRPGENIKRGQFATFIYRSHNIDQDVKPGAVKRHKTKSYNYKFSTMLNKQMSLSTLPQIDSAGTWYDASNSLTQYYLNPKNFKKESQEYYQFLKLSGSSNITTKQLNNKILKSKGVLEGRGQEFKKASQTHSVNDIYLVSHALLETGNGSSSLAKGVEVGVNKKGNPVRVTKKNRKELKDIKKTYNFFGIGAIDSCPTTCGSERAYSEGWFTPEKAIIGGAAFINNGYISKGQDTLYKMRWNPDNPATHQYATDAGWAVKQTANVKAVYDLVKDIDKVVVDFEVPKYKSQPAAKAKPTGASVFNVNKKHVHVGKKGTVTASSLNFRTGPTTNFSSIRALPKGTVVTIVGENTGWYKVKVGKQEGWVSASYINLNRARMLPNISSFSIEHPVTPDDEELLTKEENPNRVIGEIIVDAAELKKEASGQSESIVSLSKHSKVDIVEEKDDWFKIAIDENEGWIKNSSISITNVLSVKADSEVKDQPNGKTVDTLQEDETVIGIPNRSLDLTEDGDWYEVNYRGQEVWIQKDKVK